MNNTIDLFRVKLRKALLRHVVDEEVVTDLRVRVNTLAVGLSDSLCKNARVLGVEKQVDTR